VAFKCSQPPTHTPAAPLPVLLANVPFIRYMTTLSCIGRACLCVYPHFRVLGTPVAGWGCQRHWGPLFRVAAHLMADECTVDSQSPAHSPPVRILWTRVRSRSRLPYLPHSPLPCCALPADCAGLPRSQRVDATTMSSFGTPLAPSGPPPRPSRELWGSLIKSPCAYHGGGRRRPRAGPDPDALPLPLQVVCMVEQVRLPDAPPPPPSPPLPCLDSRNLSATRLWCALSWTA
jgi:hypothetical protein